jgi:hypothetical protein
MTLTNSPPAAPTAARVRLVPDRASTAGGEAIDLAASAGLFLDPWQALVVDDFLGERADGKWAALECALIVPRQNGKSRALEALALHALFLDPDARLSLWSAHQFKTAREAFRNLQAMVTNYDHLRKRVKSVRASHGEEGIELVDGSRLNFLARSRTSGRGFSGDKLILDEAQEIDPEDIASSLPMLSARPNPQIVYAGTVSPTADHLRRLHDRGAAGEVGRLAVTEFGADPDCDLDDASAWASANPAWGVRLDPEFVAMERKSYPEAAFMQERLGIWPPMISDGVIDADVWAAAADVDSDLASTPVFAVDVAPDRSAASIAVAGRRADGSWHVEVIDSKAGTSWVADRCAGLCADHGGDLVVDPGAPAGALIPALEAADVPLRLMRTRDVVQACGMFFDAVSSSSLRHLDQAPLNAAVAGASQRTVGEAWAWSRRNAAVDITPLVAATNALWGAGTVEPHGEPDVFFL